MVDWANMIGLGVRARVTVVPFVSYTIALTGSRGVELSPPRPAVLFRVHSLVGLSLWLVDWRLIDWFIEWFVEWLMEWLIGGFVGVLVRCCSPV